MIFSIANLGYFLDKSAAIYSFLDVVGWNEVQFMKLKNREIVRLTEYFNGIEEQILVLQVATTMVELQDTEEHAVFMKKKRKPIEVIRLHFDPVHSKSMRQHLPVRNVSYQDFHSIFVHM